MLVDKDYVKGRPLREVSLVDGDDKGRCDGTEGCCVEVFGEFALGCVLAKNVIGSAWMGTCR